MCPVGKSDHLAATTTLGALPWASLGWGVRAARAFPPEALEALWQDEAWETAAVPPGLEDWDSFTRAAEAALADRLGLEGAEFFGRGRGVKVQHLQVSRPLVLGAGLNKHYCAAWRAAVRRRRLAELEEAGRGAVVEAWRLRVRL